MTESNPLVIVVSLDKFVDDNAGHAPSQGTSMAPWSMSARFGNVAEYVAFGIGLGFYTVVELHSEVALAILANTIRIKRPVHEAGLPHLDCSILRARHLGCA